MPTFWFAYSGGVDRDEPLANPHARTWHVGNYIRDNLPLKWDFKYVDYADNTRHNVGLEDIIMGHLHHNHDTFMWKYASVAKSVFVIQPYNQHHMPDDWYRYMLNADHVFLNTGKVWWKRMKKAGHAELKANATRLDNAVNTRLHRRLKASWNPPGKRGILSIGRTDDKYKGIDRVIELAQITGMRFLHFGQADPQLFAGVDNARTRGWQSMDRHVVRYICDRCDFFVTLGDYDANPTTLLETAAWGLIPLTTKGSGYYPNRPFPHLTDDMVENWRRMDELNAMPAQRLQTIADGIYNTVSTQYTWQRVCETVWGVIKDYL